MFLIMERYSIFYIEISIFLIYKKIKESNRVFCLGQTKFKQRIFNSL